MPRSSRARKIQAPPGEGVAGRPGAHLDPDVRDVLDRPTEQRVEFAREGHFIPYTAAVAARDELDDLLVHPRTARMPSRLVAARSNNGKSTLVRRFAADHPMHLASDNKASRPVVLMEMPERPTANMFYSDLLQTLNVAHRTTSALAVIRDQALVVMEVLRCRMLIIDEVHNILQVGPAQQRQMLALIKTLGNRLMIPIVAAGTQDAIRTMQTDSQVEDRFGVVALPSWRLDEDLRRLLMSIERRLPLREASALDGQEIATAIYNMSTKTIGSLVHIATEAAVNAMRDGSERITPSLLGRLKLNPLKGFDVHKL